MIPQWKTRKLQKIHITAKVFKENLQTSVKIPQICKDCSRFSARIFAETCRKTPADLQIRKDRKPGKLSSCSSIKVVLSSIQRHQQRKDFGGHGSTKPSKGNVKVGYHAKCPVGVLNPISSKLKRINYHHLIAQMTKSN